MDGFRLRLSPIDSFKFFIKNTNLCKPAEILFLGDGIGLMEGLRIKSEKGERQNVETVCRRSQAGVEWGKGNNFSEFIGHKKVCS